MKAFIFALALAPFVSGCALTVSALQKPSEASPPSELIPGPDIAVSVNGTVQATVKQGAPLYVEAVISTSDIKEAPKELTLSTSAGGWGSALAIELRNAQDSPVPAAFLPAFQTEASIQIDSETLGHMVWTLDRNAAQALAPGQYTIRVLLDPASIVGGGQKDKVVAPPATLSIRGPAEQLSPQEESLAVLAEIRVQAARGQLDAALAAADRRLASEPKDGLILEAKADALAEAGRFQDAVEAYQAAISNVRPQEDSALREPPHGLIRKLALAQEAAKKANSGP